MKKKWMLFPLLLLLFTAGVRAQDFEAGDFQVKAGLGGPNWLQLAFNILPDGQENRNGLMIMPVAKAEYFVSEQMAVGLSFNYRKSSSDIYRDTFEYNGSSYSGRFGVDIDRYVLGLHGEYHPGWFAESAAKPDLYIGGMAGIGISRNTIIANSDIEDLEAINSYLSQLGLLSSTPTTTVVKPRVAAYLGFQMPISQTLGFYAEAGIGVPLIQLGLKAHF